MGKRGPMPKNKLPASNKNPVPVEIVRSSPQPYRQTKDDTDRERRYKAEDALRAIQRAEECKRDKQLMNDVKKLAAEQMSNLKAITK